MTAKQLAVRYLVARYKGHHGYDNAVMTFAFVGSQVHKDGYAELINNPMSKEPDVCIAVNKIAYFLDETLGVHWFRVVPNYGGTQFLWEKIMLLEHERKLSARTDAEIIVFVEDYFNKSIA